MRDSRYISHINAPNEWPSRFKKEKGKVVDKRHDSYEKTNLFSQPKSEIWITKTLKWVSFKGKCNENFHFSAFLYQTEA